MVRRTVEASANHSSEVVMSSSEVKREAKENGTLLEAIAVCIVYLYWLRVRCHFPRKRIAWKSLW